MTAKAYNVTLHGDGTDPETAYGVSRGRLDREIAEAIDRLPGHNADLQILIRLKLGHGEAES